MSLDSDVIVDRRRIRRKLTFWRVASVIIAIGAIAVIGTLASPGGRSAFTTTGSIARINIEGLIRSDQERVEALKTGHIRHAGLDVFNIEPMPKDHPLTKIPNVTLSAHSAFRTPEASETLIHAAWEHCRRIVKG